jgi:hypothetical protein
LASAARRRAATGKKVAVLNDGGRIAMEEVTESAFGAVGDRPVVATTSWRALHLWDPLTGRHVRKLPHDGRRAGVAIGRVGDHDVLAAGEHDEVRLWDAATGELWRSVPHAAPVTCLDGRALLVTGTGDGTVRLWDAGTQRRLATLATFAHPVHAVTAAAIGGRLSGSGQPLGFVPILLDPQVGLALDGLGCLAVPRWSPKVATVPQSGRATHGAAMRPLVLTVVRIV